MAQEVEIIGAPGFVDRFRAAVIPGLDWIERAGEEPVTVIVTEVGEILVVPAGSVHDVESGEWEK